MIAYTSESITQDQIEETLPLTNNSHTEFEPDEQQVVAQNFHGEMEKQTKTEPRMKAEHQISRIDCTDETIKAVILTEVRLVQSSSIPKGHVICTDTIKMLNRSMRRLRKLRKVKTLKYRS